MSSLNRSWMAVAAAALLLGTLVGVVWARPHDQTRAPDITRKVTLAGADFTSVDNIQPCSNHGNYVTCGPGGGAFVAPVVFPCLPSVTVTGIQLHVDDPADTVNIVAYLYREYPAKGVPQLLGVVNYPLGTTEGIETFTAKVDDEVVWPSQRAYVYLELEGNILKAYGVTVLYHRNI
jgi:hypothetical protein